MADLDLAAAGALTTTELYDNANELHLMLNTIGIQVREKTIL